MASGGSFELCKIGQWGDRKRQMKLRRVGAGEALVPAAEIASRATSDN
jgi:hypothetical protein